MNKIYKVIVLLLTISTLVVFGNKINAQTPDTATTEKLLHYIMQPLNKSQITTGFLQEWETITFLSQHPPAIMGKLRFNFPHQNQTLEI